MRVVLFCNDRTLVPLAKILYNRFAAVPMVFRRILYPWTSPKRIFASAIFRIKSVSDGNFIRADLSIFKGYPVTTEMPKFDETFTTGPKRA